MAVELNATQVFVLGDNFYSSGIHTPADGSAALPRQSSRLAVLLPCCPFFASPVSYLLVSVLGDNVYVSGIHTPADGPGCLPRP